MTLPAYVLQLLTNATEPALPVSWQAGSTLSPAAAGPNVLEDPAAFLLLARKRIMSNKWIAQAYGIDALVDDKGEILASVRAGHGDYTYKGRSFIDRASAKNAAERDHGGVEAMTTPSLPNYSAGAR